MWGFFCCFLLLSSLVEGKLFLSFPPSCSTSTPFLTQFSFFLVSPSPLPQKVLLFFLRFILPETRFCVNWGTISGLQQYKKRLNNHQLISNKRPNLVPSALFPPNTLIIEENISGFSCLEEFQIKNGDVLYYWPTVNIGQYWHLNVILEINRIGLYFFK